MTFRTRTLARAAAAGLLAAGGFAVTGTPALAGDPADLEVKLTGTTIAATNIDKAANLSVLNHGPADAADVRITIDLTRLRSERVSLAGVGDGCSAQPGEKRLVCVLDPAVLRSGEDADLPFVLASSAVPGDAGSITVSVTSTTADSDPANNAVTVKVAVGDSGIDLEVLAFDVYAFDEQGDVSDQPVAPGQTAPLIIRVVNQGDVTAGGFVASATVPAGASFNREVMQRFPGEFAGCAVAGRTATCDFSELPLSSLPGPQDPPGTQVGYVFALPVTVDAGAAAGVNLTDGVVTVTGIEVDRADLRKRSTPPALPRGVKALTAAEAKDVDATDNTDGFTVFVASATPGDGGQGGGDGDGGELPITGVNVAVVGGVGAGVLVLGALLFFLSRRRRVVVVAPGDETPTA